MIVRLFPILVGAVLLAVLVPAAEAKPSVPRGFMGVMLDGGAERDPDSVLKRQTTLMARSGVETVRVVFPWTEIQPVEGPFDFRATDRLVAAAAARGIGVLPVLLYTPSWAAALPARGQAAPPRIKPFQAFVRAAIGRYGPRGSFWRQFGSLPRRPIRYWQVWNEPHFQGFWSAPNASRYAWPRGYARLLKAANSTIHRTDRGARTVTAGLFGETWNLLSQLYRSGGRGTFDVVAAHVYTRREANVLEVTRRVNRTMRRARDRGKRIWITEVSFPASRGKAKPIGDQGQETPRGMARRLYNTFLLLARNRKRQRLDRVYWYTWASSYEQVQPSNFDYAGLMARSGPFSYTPQPALGSFRRIAQRLRR